jgi:hypothetical protein
MDVILVSSAPPPASPATTARRGVDFSAIRSHAQVLRTAKNANISSRQPSIAQNTAV